MNCIKTFEIDIKRQFVKDQKIKTAAILNKLSINRITANNLLGLFLKSAIIRSDLDLEFVIFLMQDGESEKKATSPPETSPDNIINKNNKKILTNTNVSISRNRNSEYKNQILKRKIV